MIYVFLKAQCPLLGLDLFGFARENIERVLGHSLQDGSEQITADALEKFKEVQAKKEEALKTEQKAKMQRVYGQQQEDGQQQEEEEGQTPAKETVSVKKLVKLDEVLMAALLDEACV